MVRALIRAVDGLRRNFRGFAFVSHGPWLARNIKGALALSRFGGIRLAEGALVDGTTFTAMKIPRLSLFFIIDGVVKRSPNAKELIGMRRGRILLTTPSMMKNKDVLGIFMAVKVAPFTSATSARRKPPNPESASAPLMLRANQRPWDTKAKPRKFLRNPSAA
jgi:hypothetical protein